MGQIIENKIITVRGRQGAGKTFFSVFLASFYPIIYSNIDIKKDGLSCCNYIESMKDLEDLPFHKKKGVVLFDEMGVNINSREFRSQANIDFSKLLALSRKLNLDFILITQRKRLMDVNARELTEYMYLVKKRYTGHNYIQFDVNIEYVSDEGYNSLVGERVFDLILWSKMTGYSYNSIEKSKIKKEKPTITFKNLELKANLSKSDN